MSNTYYQIEEVALKTGLTKRALRYYEDIELITPIRTEAGYRLYTEEDIENILKIKELRDSLGFNLNDIKSVLDLGEILKDILYKRKEYNSELVLYCINEVKQKIQFIEQKEESLKSIKGKYNDVLQKLLQLNQDSESKEE